MIKRRPQLCQCATRTIEHSCVTLIFVAICLVPGFDKKNVHSDCFLNQNVAVMRLLSLSVRQEVTTFGRNRIKAMSRLGSKFVVALRPEVSS